MNNSRNLWKVSSDLSLNVTVKAGLSLIPVIGTSLAATYDEINNKIQVERLESFITELKEDLANLERDLNNKIISKEEYGIIVEKILRAVRVETNSEKRTYFKKIFINGLILNDVESYKLENFTDILSGLNIIDITVLKLLNEKNQIVPIRSISSPDFSDEELYGSINKLKSFGFVNINMSAMTIAGPQSSVKENLVLNRHGKSFLYYCLN